MDWPMELNNEFSYHRQCNPWSHTWRQKCGLSMQVCPRGFRFANSYCSNIIVRCTQRFKPIKYWILLYKVLNNYWMRSSRIWGISKAEVCVICQSRRLRQIAQTEALIIPHFLREPNSIIVLLFICICKPFSWRSHLYFKFLHKQHKPFVFCISHKQHKLVWRHMVV